MNNKEKTAFRRTSKWKDFRKLMLIKRNYQCEMCAIIKKAGLNLHHLDEQHYTDLTPTKFRVLCKADHQLLERLLRRKEFDIDAYCVALKECYLLTKGSNG